MKTRIALVCALSGIPLAGIADSTNASMLSAYVGILNSAAVYNIAGCPLEPGQTGAGMPVVFDTEIDQSTLDESDFLITYRDAAGALVTVTPDCAGLAPADEEYEDRTVLTVGQFDGNTVQRVEVVANSNLADENGNRLAGLAAQKISLFGEPEQLVYAEILAEDVWEPGECPSNTRLAIQVTWNGGITGPAATQLNDDIQAQDYLITFTRDDGYETTRYPDVLTDLGDGDNNHVLCITGRLPRGTLKIQVTGLAGQFCSPAEICTVQDSTIVLR